MTRTTNARITGFTFLLYIAAGVGSMAGLSRNALANVTLSLLMCFSALTLGVTLYAITRDEDRDIAMFGLACRVAEGVLGAAFMPIRLALPAVGASASTASEAQAALDAILTSARGSNILVSAIFFAAGSTAFCWLLLRGRMIPSLLAWLGVLASVLLVISLPLQLARVIDGGFATFVWLPMAVFEVAFALWLIARGSSLPAVKPPFQSAE
ncbi:MAG: DUF4386 domain-containing protein [Acidobacteria bacterium]|nr:MAG: DUF4386 domain-containing protein [Acidobacteriota bacterium]